MQTVCQTWLNLVTLTCVSCKWRSAWPIFHGSVILPYILNSIWCMNMIIWDNCSVWPDVWPQNKLRSLWPIFHSSVILPYILMTTCIWCVNMTVWVQFDRKFDLKIKVDHFDLHFTVQWFCPISWRLFDDWFWFDFCFTALQQFLGHFGCG